MPNNSDVPLTFNAMIWLRTYLPTSTDLADHDLDHVRDFVLMWGIFEAEACNANAKPFVIRKAVNKLDDKKKLDLQEFLPYGNFFLKIAGRYSTTEEFLNALGQKKNDEDKANVYRDIGEFVDKKRGDVNNIVVALLLIAYRIRNNTFHGSKAPENMLSQQDVFNALNSLLAKFVSITRMA